MGKMFFTWRLLVKDGMDQAKWALPRLREFVNAKELGRYQRPKVKLHAVWCHSIGLHVYVVDPRQGSGANTICETASQSLEKVAAKMGNKMPHHMLVMCDNTVKESKNATVLSWMSSMIAKHRFRSGGLMMARVGHTHTWPSRCLGICLVLGSV